MNNKIIITGATGMVGEGVFNWVPGTSTGFRCTQCEQKTKRNVAPKTERIYSTWFLKSKRWWRKSEKACFFCAGVSSVGLKEAEYIRITSDTTIQFAKVLLHQNPEITFIYVSGASTDSSEKGRMMWARVKGRTENALLKMPFKKSTISAPGLWKLRRVKKMRWSFTNMLAGCIRS